jgi:pyrophosphatase PpaX
MKVNTLLFDLDGTLVDTNGIIVKALEVVFGEFLPEVDATLDLMKECIGPPLEVSFTRFVDQDTAQQMIRRYREYYKAHEHLYYSIYPNVIDVLTTLKAQGYYLGVVTSKFRDSAMPSMVHYGIDSLMDVIVGLDDVTKAKPDREPVDLALSQLPSHTGAIMIGDNATDVQSGQNAGVYAAGVAWAFKGRDQLIAVNPDYMLEDMTDLYEILNELNK